VVLLRFVVLSLAGHLETRKGEPPSRIGEKDLFIDGAVQSKEILVNL